MARAIGDPQNERSQRTRAALLAATRSLLEETGFEGLTMATVAERAGVTRRAVYLHFRSRTELVTELFDYVAEQEGLAASQQPVWDAPDAVTALDEWAHHLARYHPRVLPVDRAVQRVRLIDADAARHHQVVTDRQRAAARRLADRLAAEERLAEPWTVATAADMIWALASSEIIERLVVERRWGQRRLADHLSQVLRGALVAKPPSLAGDGTTPTSPDPENTGTAEAVADTGHHAGHRPAR
jgi:AcrR family transcriptional regulator